MSKLKLKVGKKYVSYNGEIITIVEYDPDYVCCGYYYPYRGDNNRTYTEHGTLCVVAIEVYRGIYDLVKEYKEDKQNTMKLELGKRYVTRGGNIVTIIKYDSDYKFRGVKYPYKGNNWHTYKEDGSFITLDDDVSNLDIIKEYE